ncbi:ATP-binding protein [Clostridium botulinum C/D]|uniref:ATP-binding protein n=1 Tax=Clostridium botulinum TaxID=1491 RepID=UPI001E37933F|nr:ATP-binding protein [Clostridium botulinum]MCD3211080.1 ATP-binding protein [Clostridium botulinum C/D]
METNLQSKVLDYSIEHCSKCGEATSKIVKIFNREMIVPISCKCKREENKRKEIAEANREKQVRLDRLKKNSLMDKKFKDSAFKNWDFNRGNKKMYRIGTKYAANFKSMKDKNIGLLLHGEPGNGKTYTASAIANALIEKGIPTICVHVEALLNKIKETYKKWGSEVEEDILRGLTNADLLIIDDLGTEQETDWATTKIYNILDSRYRKELPLIITTNLPLLELENRYSKRTYDRLLEMCTPVLNNGQSIRVEKAKEKTKILKELLN